MILGIAALLAGGGALRVSSTRSATRRAVTDSLTADAQTRLIGVSTNEWRFATAQREVLDYRVARGRRIVAILADEACEPCESRTKSVRRAILSDSTRERFELWHLGARGPRTSRESSIGLVERWLAVANWPVASKHLERVATPLVMVIDSSGLVTGASVGYYGGMDESWLLRIR